MPFIPSLLFAATTLLPISDGVPNLNVAASCKGATQIQIAESQSYDDCMKEENDARDQLLQSWQSFAVADRQSCTSEASLGGMASYVELLTCLQLAAQVAPEGRTKLKGARRK